VKFSADVITEWQTK